MHLQTLAPAKYIRTGDSDPVPWYHFPVLGHLYRKRVARCISLLPQGHSVLEAGYGSGVSFLNLSRKFDEIHGIDLHERAEDVVNSFRGTGLNLHLRQGNILDLPYADASLDAALAVSIHEHLAPAEQARAFAEIYRVLRPGGCYVVGVPGLNMLMTTAFYLLGHRIREHHLTSEKEVLAAMGRHFDIDAASYTPRPLPASLTCYVYARGWKR